MVMRSENLTGFCRNTSIPSGADRASAALPPPLMTTMGIPAQSGFWRAALIRSKPSIPGM